MVDGSISRRGVLAAAAGAIGTSGFTTVASAGSGTAEDPPDGSEAFRRLGRTLLPEELETAVVEPDDLVVEDNRIGPGSPVIIEGLPDPEAEGGEGSSYCTANFLWRSGGNPGREGGPGSLPEGAAADDERLYLGIAGHCLLTEGHVDENAKSDAEDEDDVSSTASVTAYACIDCPLGGTAFLESRAVWNAVVGDDDSNPTVRLVELGDVAYARDEEPGGGEGIGYDFGLIEVSDDVPVELVDPAMPRWGGPYRSGEVEPGDPIVTYGNSQVLGETVATKARPGVGQYYDDGHGAWYGVLPIAFGDSGAAVLTAAPGTGLFEGDAAAGVATHVAAPSPTVSLDLEETVESLRAGGFAGTGLEQCRALVEADTSEEISVVTVDDWT